jgi:hypothetical protein
MPWSEILVSCLVYCFFKQIVDIFFYKAYYQESNTGADPGFQVRGEHLEKLRRAEGGAKYFGVFCVKNHDFTHLDPPLKYTNNSE